MIESARTTPPGYGPRTLAASAPASVAHMAPAGPTTLAAVALALATRPPSGGGGPAPTSCPVGIATWPQFAADGL